MGNTNCLCVGKWSLRTRLTGFSLWVLLYLLISNHVTILPIQKMFICILLKEWTEEKTNKNLYMSMQSHKQNTCIGEMGYYYIKMVIIFSLFLQNFYNVVMKDIFKMFNLLLPLPHQYFNCYSWWERRKWRLETPESQFHSIFNKRKNRPSLKSWQVNSFQSFMKIHGV